MSSLAWIDSDEAERQRTDRILALFNERETRDELGLGSIRDSIADHLFPGTSTIQTRIRYMLFVPWIFQMLRPRDLTQRELADKARVLEFQLSQALLQGEETLGVIGRDAGINLRRLPSSVYWAGLASWGIRKYQGSIDGYFSNIRKPDASHQAAEGEEGISIGRGFAPWHSSLPKPPKDLLVSTKFDLAEDESQFFVDMLVANQPRALLTFLAKKGISADCDFIWEHPHLTEFSLESRRLIEHGRMFSQVSHGASLLYNFQLAELKKDEESIEAYRGELQDWRSNLTLDDVSNWSLDEFFGVVAHPSHRIPSRAVQFVRTWVENVIGCRAEIESSSSAQKLVQDREMTLKRSQSRFLNPTMLDRWSGASGTGQFEFRWYQAKSHLRDIKNGT